MSEIRALQDEIKAWADAVFPARTSRGALVKLAMEEIPELIRDIKSPGEYADCIILLLDIASLEGIDVADAIRDKMEVNRRRTWRVNETTGLMHHE